jgi:hypothetical protein
MDWHRGILSPLFLMGSLAFAQTSPLEGRADIGTVLHAGSDSWEGSSGTYTVSGSGANMWFGEDDFHFVWKRVTGDVAVSAFIAFAAPGGDPHRKAVLMIRQSLDADSVYADAALHGDGLTSLQFRTAKGEATHEIRSNQSAPRRLQIEKRGDLFYLSVAGPNEDLHFAGGSIRVPIKGPFYVGIGVCAHNKDDIRKAVFTDVRIDAGSHPASAAYSTLETIDVASTDALTTYVRAGPIESPAWSKDGTSLTFRSGAETYWVPAAGGDARPTTPEAASGNGSGGDSTGTSPDGKWAASFSRPSGSEQNGGTVLSVTSAADKKVKVLATFQGVEGSTDAPAWSPDSRRIAFVSRQHY